MMFTQGGQMLKLRKQQKAAFSTIKSSTKEADIFY
jgi:hypothetical protein